MRMLSASASDLTHPSEEQRDPSTPVHPGSLWDKLILSDEALPCDRDLGEYKYRDQDYLDGPTEDVLKYSW